MYSLSALHWTSQRYVILYIFHAIHMCKERTYFQVIAHMHAVTSE